ncbi:hypothetical protein, partial [Actinomyces succiniciruminis]
MTLRITAVTLTAICTIALTLTGIAPNAAAESQHDPALRAYAAQDSVTVTGGTSYQMYTYVPGKPVTQGTVDGGGGVFDEHAAKMA